MNKLTKILCASIISLSTITTPSFAQDASCQTISFAETGWADISATTGLMSVIAEGLGYKVNTPVASVPIAFTSIAKGRLDVFLGYWSPSMDSMVAPFIKKNQFIIPKKPNLEGAKYTLAVPRYTYEAGLKSFADIAKFKDQLNGELYGIEAGNDGNIILQKMIDDNLYNVGDFKLKESSEAAMLSQVKRSIKAKKPIVFLAWEPHPMNTQIDLNYLSGGDDVFGPNYGSAKVYTVISPSFAKRCPIETDFISNIQFTTEMENEIMTAILEDKVAPKQAAKNWLKNHPEILDKWLTNVKALDGTNGKEAVEKHLQK